MDNFEERKEMLLRLPVVTLVERVIKLENELEESRTYRRRLIQEGELKSFFKYPLYCQEVDIGYEFLSLG